MKNIEIEKKILLKRNFDLSELKNTKSCKIEQIYIRDEELIEERIRKISWIKNGKTEYTNTIKKDIVKNKNKNTTQRYEEEIEINKDEYEKLSKNKIKSINKIRHFIEPHNDIITELIIDEFDDFLMMEIEFMLNSSNENNKEEINKIIEKIEVVMDGHADPKLLENYIPKDVALLLIGGKDVSGDSRYKNKNLAK